MKKDLSFITVIGKDQKGIVAGISNLLYKSDINIEDINQKVIEGFFVMTMLVDLSACKCSLKKLSDDLNRLGLKMGLKIQIQHENVFKMMHRV